MHEVLVRSTSAKEETMASPLSTTALLLNSILSTTLSATTPALTTAQFGQIPQIGLPGGRGTPIQSASNTSPSKIGRAHV